MVNFISAQYCKRCDTPIEQKSAADNETRFIVNNDTSFRPAAPRQNQAQFDQFSQPSFSNQSMENTGWQLPRFPVDGNDDYYNRESYGQQYQTQNPPPDSYQYQSEPNFRQQSAHNFHQYQNQAPTNYGFSNEPLIRRFGNDIALHQNGNLPSNCVKCGVPVSAANGVMVTEKFRWHNPLVYIALISPLIYLILALALSKRFKVNVPLCHLHNKSRKDTGNFLTFGGLGLFVVMMIAGFNDFGGFALLPFLFGLIALPITYTYFYKALRVKGVEGNYYHLSGASDEYLRNIPY